METAQNGHLNGGMTERKHGPGKKITVHQNSNGVAYSNGDVDHKLTNGHAAPIDKRTESSTSSSLIGQIVTCCIAGFIFGFVLEKGRVFESAVIQDQMLFRRNLMLKMFLGAIAASQVSFTLLSLIPRTSQLVANTRDAFINRIGDRSITSAAIGAALLGSGMAISGACPGQILVQIGHGIPNSGITFLGGCCGALLYGLTESYVTGLTRPTKPYRVQKLDDILSKPFIISVMPVMFLLVAFTYVLDLIGPWQTELTTQNKDDANVFTLNAWPPYLSGALVGLLQIPMVINLNKPLGSSNSYCTLSSRLFPAAMLQAVSPYLYRARSGIGNWWQVIYLSCAVAGAYYSAYLSGSVASVPGTSAVASFTGGLVMLYGSRMAGGCTCGHGLSGTGMLSLLSFVAVPFMFVGGVSTALVLSGVNEFVF